MAKSSNESRKPAGATARMSVRNAKLREGHRQCPSWCHGKDVGDGQGFWRQKADCVYVCEGVTGRGTGDSRGVEMLLALLRVVPHMCTLSKTH